MWNYFPDMEPVIHENADLMQVLARLAHRHRIKDMIPVTERWMNGRYFLRVGSGKWEEYPLLGNAPSRLQFMYPLPWENPVE